jgi:hypothetical protein
VPHEPIRYLVFVMQRLVHGTSSSTITTRWRTPCTSHSSASAPLPAQLTAEHEALTAIFHSIDALESRIAACNSDAEGKERTGELQEQVTRLADVMREHLSEEEVSVTAALRDHFTCQEHDAMLQRVVAAIPPSVVPLVLSFVCGAQLRLGGKAALEAYLAERGPQVVAGFVVWRPMMEAEVAYVSAVTLNQDNEPEFDTARPHWSAVAISSSSSFCCSCSQSAAQDPHPNLHRLIQ